MLRGPSKPPDATEVAVNARTLGAADVAARLITPRRYHGWTGFPRVSNGLLRGLTHAQIAERCRCAAPSRANPPQLINQAPMEVWTDAQSLNIGAARPASPGTPAERDKWTPSECATKSPRWPGRWRRPGQSGEDSGCSPRTGVQSSRPIADGFALPARSPSTPSPREPPYRIPGEPG